MGVVSTDGAIMKRRRWMKRFFTDTDTDGLPHGTVADDADE
eukprot:NODE_10558_length_203_cov_216.415584_g9398_i0.p3 GENE.NODE_10558_length_203_cov_216.415584_g9398_i0~~NODE_10558_length_203_cov_216.415584_g9398_i0.p3  ORF type:complete len:50 (-),score=37.22 NODE_10558_length_203_cov_216.415584_g9398_i0:52-174(-)